mmetsp:Transcript_29929/g.85908  ORF Transcript_29929/g.85908 Transcript_29929/m.85908 type:complete len:365 (-) Transcript_29929:76-1170(-)
MGNIESIRFHTDQPSLVDEGQISAVSDLIGPDLVDNMQEFFDELIQYVKDPIPFTDIGALWLLHDITFEEAGDGAQVMRVFMDGDKIRRQVPKDEEPPDWMPKGIFCHIRAWIKVDRVKRRITTIHYWPPESDVMKLNCTTTFVPVDEGGFRVEVFALNPEDLSDRRGGPGIAMLAEWLFLKPMLLSRFQQKVKVRSNVWTESSGGLSTVSDPADMYFDREQLFDAMVQFIRQETLNKPEGDIIDKSDTEFTTINRVEVPMPAPEGEAQTMFPLDIRATWILDAKEKWITSMTHVNGELIYSHFWRIHAMPVRVEMWKMQASGARCAGGQEGMILRAVMTALCSEADLRDQVEGLGKDSNNFYF